MTSLTPTLHMFCGKIAAGKSTLARQLADRDGAVLIVEDDWLAALYPGEINGIADYVRVAKRLRGVMAPHVVALLNAGQSVVLDFPANTAEQRQWMRDILDLAHVAHQMHLLDLPDDLCRARLRARNAQGDHPFAATEAQFDQFARHFVPPTPGEGFNVVVHGADQSLSSPGAPG